MEGQKALKIIWVPKIKESLTGLEWHIKDRILTYTFNRENVGYTTKQIEQIYYRTIDEIIELFGYSYTLDNILISLSITTPSFCFSQWHECINSLTSLLMVYFKINQHIHNILQR